MTVQPFAPCDHRVVTYIIDELGPMTDAGPAMDALFSAQAHVRVSHYECSDCGAIKPNAGAKEEDRVWKRTVRPAAANADQNG